MPQVADFQLFTKKIYLMKNTKYFAFILLLLVSCNSPTQQTAPEQEAPPEPVDLLGNISRSDLQKAPFNEWFDSEYQAYQVSETATEVDLSEVEITMVMGTWCSDSQREVPHLFKLLDQLNFPEEKISMIAIDEDKAEPASDIEKWGVEYVPTIILLKDGTEVGRIVEAPAETLEADMKNILTQG